MTKIEDWHWISMKENPADGITRGRFPKLFKDHLYVDGPVFLREEVYMIPEEPSARPFDETEELKNQSQPVIMCIASDSSIFPARYLDQFSDFYRMKLSVAWLSRYVRYIASFKNMNEVGPVKREELEEAEKIVIRIIQKSYYAELVERLQKSRQPLKRDALSQFNPKIEEGIVRIGGRLNQGTDLPYDVRHPVLLPPIGNVTSLIIRDAHHFLMHGSARNTTNLLRAKYWFPR